MKSKIVKNADTALWDEKLAEAMVFSDGLTELPAPTISEDWDELLILIPEKSFVGGGNEMTPEHRKENYAYVKADYAKGKAGAITPNVITLFCQHRQFRRIMIPVLKKYLKEKYDIIVTESERGGLRINGDKFAGSQALLHPSKCFNAMYITIEIDEKLFDELHDTWRTDGVTSLKAHIPNIDKDEFINTFEKLIIEEYTKNI